MTRNKTKPKNTFYKKKKRLFTIHSLSAKLITTLILHNTYSSSHFVKMLCNHYCIIVMRTRSFWAQLDMVTKTTGNTGYDESSHVSSTKLRLSIWSSMRDIHDWKHNDVSSRRNDSDAGTTEIHYSFTNDRLSP